MEVDETRIDHMMHELNKAGGAMYAFLELANGSPKAEPLLDDIQEIIDSIYELDVKLNMLKKAHGNVQEYFVVRRECELKLWKQMLSDYNYDN